MNSFDISIDNIYCMNCLQGMTSMEDNTVDLIIADPPYNLSKGRSWTWDNSVALKGMGGNWKKVMENWDSLPLEDYWKFSFAWISEAKRILKPTGSMWIFGTYHNMGIINAVLQMTETEIINEVIWFKRNAFPNLSGRRLTASHETILWCHSGGKKRQYYFDYEYSKDGVFEGDQIKVQGKQMRTVWDISNNKSKRELEFGKHPTQKPLKVLDRMIRISSKPGDIMLTPFAGAGSECLAAKEAGLHYIGFETEEEYVAIAKTRIDHAIIKKRTLYQRPEQSALFE